MEKLMSEPYPHPREFEHLVDLASDGVGGMALYATDEFFAEKDALLRPGAPQFLADKYTDRGKWMDGWESQRRRTPGHDYCVIRLGLPGRVRGVCVDTTHFRGNAPAECQIEGIEGALHTPLETLKADSGYTVLLPRTPLRPNTQNVFSIAAPASDQRVTHLKLRIYPDGGVARLRIYGEVVPDERVFWQVAAVDLCAVENGGTIAAASDRFFGPPSNLLLPGRGVNMGDGWETARRRTPGSDWAVIRLGRPGVIERIELDTHFFKGNAPQACLIEALDARGWDEERITAELTSPNGLSQRLSGEHRWRPLLDYARLERHTRHWFAPDRPLSATHVRVHIFPHGGVNRLRLYGHALDSERDQRALSSLNQMEEDEARALLASFCGASEFVERMLRGRPYLTARELFMMARRVFFSLDEAQWLEAFAAHPRLGQNHAAPAQTARSAAWSRGEQESLAHSDDAVREQLLLLNETYAQKFGFIFILCATGLPPREVLAALERRIERPRAVEIEAAASEQVRITELRIGKWLRGA
jgi:allantoicase